MRFHLAAGKLPRQQLVATLRQLLKRPDLADLVMNDLARAEDWESIDEIMDLFRNGDQKSDWVRIPAVRYLRACPLPQARQYLRECEQIDAAAVERASRF
jgi:hypothetical protein